MYGLDVRIDSLLACLTSKGKGLMIELWQKNNCFIVELNNIEWEPVFKAWKWCQDSQQVTVISGPEGSRRWAEVALLYWFLYQFDCFFGFLLSQINADYLHLMVLSYLLHKYRTYVTLNFWALTHVIWRVGKKRKDIY